MEDYTTLIDSTNKEQRLHLVEQIKRKGITDPEVLAAIAFVPREYFVHPSFVNRSYEDTALPIDCNQTISQPYTVAYMTQLLNVKEGSKILEIGTGSGYQATILKVLGAKVFSIERIPELYHELLTLFGNLKINVNLKLGDGTLGWKQYAPYKGIVVTAAAPFIPHSLEDQLSVGGRLVIPVGDKDGQLMHLVERVDHKTFRDTELDDFKFVPLIGKQGWSE
jgi:protein-L-isoaspartate(D-aspartate) O-methyltransferase